MDLDSEEFWKKRLLKSFNKESYETEERVDVNENRGEITMDEDFHLEWDNSSHLFWYEDAPGDSDMSLLSLKSKTNSLLSSFLRVHFVFKKENKTISSEAAAVC